VKYCRKLSNYFMPTLKEDPREAEIPSHKLMIRAGMIRKLASGVYEFLPIGWRVVRKIEAIIREEMDAIGGQEIEMSALQPRNLWEQSGRWGLYGPELMRLKDRGDREFCLGPTHEEVITRIVGDEVKSYKELPLLLYQFQTKFRDEIRPRFGIMRAREFYMKDAYSFDSTMEGCRKSYQDNVEAYTKIFERCGLDFVKVEAETGNIGGQYSHEFMVIADTGEEEIAVCSCGYGSNTELADYKRSPVKKEEVKESALEEVHTPDARTVDEVAEFLSEPARKFIKTLIYKSSSGLLAALVRGDHELNENHLKKAAGAGELHPAGEEEIKQATGAPVGFAGPVGLGIPVYADEDVIEIKNAVSGANKNEYHLKNINYGRDYTAFWTGNLRKITKDDLCPECSSKLEFKRGIEVGHTFLLGTKYSESMQAAFAAEDGSEKPFIMGCYGIGVTRVAAAAIEQCYDKDGIVWPASIAPFQIIIIQLTRKTKDLCGELYKKLGEKYEVLWDDRDLNPGVKFKDAQLIGVPVQVVAGKSYLNEGKLEINDRRTGEKEYVAPESLEEKLNEKI